MSSTTKTPALSPSPSPTIPAIDSPPSEISFFSVNKETIITFFIVFLIIIGLVGALLYRWWTIRRAKERKNFERFSLVETLNTRARERRLVHQPPTLFTNPLRQEVSASRLDPSLLTLPASVALADESSDRKAPQFELSGFIRGLQLPPPPPPPLEAALPLSPIGGRRKHYV